MENIIRRYRRLKKLTQKQLADQIITGTGRKMTPQYINLIENDGRAIRSKDLAKQFANVLGISLDYLFMSTGSVSAELQEAVNSMGVKRFDNALKVFLAEDFTRGTNAFNDVMADFDFYFFLSKKSDYDRMKLLRRLLSELVMLAQSTNNLNLKKFANRMLDFVHDDLFFKEVMQVEAETKGEL